MTGTDTGVGKTYVASQIVRELRAQGVRVGAYKPVCTGADILLDGRPAWRDVDELSRAIGGEDLHDRICPQRFRAPVAPPVAARLEGGQVDSGLLRAGAEWWKEDVDVLVVEGVGGLLCPLSDDMAVADLAWDLRFPLIIVARLELGTINHTLLTLEVARHRRLPIAGIVLNEVGPPSDGAADRAERDEISRRCTVPILAVARHNRPARLLHDEGEFKIDWLELAGNQESEGRSQRLEIRDQ